MRHFSPKKLLIISLVIFLFSIFIFYFLYKNIEIKKHSNLELKEEWVKEETRRENAKSLANILLSVKEEKAILENHFVYKSDLVPFLDTLERLASISGNKREITSVEVAKDNTGLLVNIGVTGSFESLYEYVLLLENAPYEMEFLSADIKNTSSQFELNKN